VYVVVGACVWLCMWAFHFNFRLDFRIYHILHVRSSAQVQFYPAIVGETGANTPTE
jgi:hypothetical protein